VLALEIAIRGSAIHTNNLNLDIDLDETLGERVDLDKTWIDCAIETTKFGDETDITLRNGLVRVGTEDTAWNSTHGSNARTQGVDHASIPAMSSLVAFASKCLRIRRLKILSLWWFDIDQRVVTARSVCWAKSNAVC